MFFNFNCILNFVTVFYFFPLLIISAGSLYIRRVKVFEINMIYLHSQWDRDRSDAQLFVLKANFWIHTNTSTLQRLLISKRMFEEYLLKYILSFYIKTCYSYICRRHKSSNISTLKNWRSDNRRIESLNNSTNLNKCDIKMGVEQNIIETNKCR